MNSKERDREPNPRSNDSGTPPEGISRRRFLASAGAAGGAAATAHVWLSGVTYGRAAAGDKTFVLINQRGGMDALSVLAPFADPEYILRRPTIKVEAPADPRAMLDGTFAMSPGGVSPDAIDWLTPYHDGHLAFVHGAGIMGQGRSHFTSQLVLEHGVNPGVAFPPDGWGARYLNEAPASGSPVRGLTHGALLPTVMRGAPATSPVPSLANLGFPGPDDPGPVPTEPFRSLAIESAYSTTPFVAAMESAASAFTTLRELTSVDYPTPGSGDYPNTPFGNALADTAAIIKDPDVHVEMVHIDIGSWDHHAAQDPNNPGGLLYDILNDFSRSIGAFYLDLGGPAGVDDYLMCTYTEFGRKTQENLSLGTDHGTGSAMMAMGCGLHQSVGGAGGTVFAEFGPIATAYDPAGDSLVTTIDFRDVFKEALENQLCLDPADFGTVFQGFTPRVTPPGIIG